MKERDVSFDAILIFSKRGRSQILDTAGCMMPVAG